MEPFLFPHALSGTETPLNDLVERIIPSAKKSVLIIDPSPCSPCVRAALALSDRHVYPRILSRVEPLSIQGSSDHWSQIAAMTRAVEQGRAEFRCIQDLGVHLFVIDDAVLLSAGPLDRMIAYAIRLDGNEAYQTIEFAETLWKSARRMTPGRLEEHRKQFEAAVSKGEVSASDVVAMINARGAFVQIHTGFYLKNRGTSLPSIPGVEQMTRTSADGQAVWSAPRWNFIDSIHFTRLGRLSARMHALTHRAYLHPTPAGVFLRNKDRIRWENEFDRRAERFREESSDYTRSHYASFRESARIRLEELVQRMLDSMSKQVLLPFTDLDEWKASYLETCMRLYPDVESLADSCRTWYIRFGMHPDSIRDPRLSTLIADIAFQTHTDLDFHNGDSHD